MANGFVVFSTEEVRIVHGQTAEYTTGTGNPVPVIVNDGLKNQVILLEEISRELDDYFTRTHLVK